MHTWLLSLTGYRVTAAIAFIVTISCIAVIVRNYAIGSEDVHHVGDGYSLLPMSNGESKDSGLNSSRTLSDDDLKCYDATLVNMSARQAVLRPRILVWSRQLILTSLCVAASFRIYFYASEMGPRLSRVDGIVDVIAHILWWMGMAALLHMDGISNLLDERGNIKLWLPAYLFISIHYIIELACSNDSVLLLCFALSLVLVVLAFISAYSNWCYPQERAPTAEYTCSLPAALSFSHLNQSIIAPGMKKTALEFCDVPPLSDCDSAAPVWRLFVNVLHRSVAEYQNVEKDQQTDTLHVNQKMNKKLEPTHLYAALARYRGRDELGLFWSLWRLVYWEWLAQGFFQFVSSCVTFIAPLALERILVHVGAGATTTENNLSVAPLLPMSVNVAVALLFLGPLMKGITDGQNFVRGRHIGVRVKAALITAIYDKVLKVDLSRCEESVGRLNNLISVDVDDVQIFCAYSHFLWSTPLELTLSTLLLFFVLGKAMIGGIVVLLLSFLFGLQMSRIMKQLQERLLKDKDARMSIISEVLNSIRVIKFSAWESRFNRKISSARGQELQSLLKRSLVDAVLNVTWEIVPVLVSAASFIVQVYILGIPLNPAVGFTSLTLFNLMRWPLNALPDMINYFVRTCTSIRRMEQFFLVKDVRGLSSNEDSAATSTTQPARYQAVHTPVQESPASKIAARLAQLQKQRCSGHVSRAKKSVTFCESVSGGDVSPPAVVVAEHLTFGWWAGIEHEMINDDVRIQSWSRCCSPLSCCTFGNYNRAAEIDDIYQTDGCTSGSSLESCSVSSLGRFLCCSNASQGVYRKVSRSEGSSDSSFLCGCCCPNAHGVADRGLHHKLLEQHDQIDSSNNNSFVIIMEEASFSIHKGALAVIVGPTGSGKSSLLQGALLGEGGMLRGHTALGGSVSYAPQSPWIQNATLRDNILFGRPFDKLRYERVLHACALETDIKLLPAGDRTEIGEKGVNLSGGQQQRVSLARAAYADSDVILLDDPLSAVDTVVGEHIFRELIMKLLSARTRLLVTHNLPLTVPSANIVLYIDSGSSIKDASLSHGVHSGCKRNLTCCSPSSLRSVLQHDAPHDDLAANSFANALISAADVSPVLNSEVDEKKSSSSVGHGISMSSANHSYNTLSQDLVNQSVQRLTASTESNNAVNNNYEPRDGRITVVETKNVGTISWPAYWYYMKEGGGLLAVIALIVGCLSTSVAWLLYGVALGKWMESMTNGSLHDRQQRYWFLLFWLSAVGVILAFVMRITSKTITLLRASHRIHWQLTKSVICAPCYWFDATPIGRIINRFSQDISTIDSKVPHHLYGFMDCIVETSQIIGVIAYALPLLLLPFLPILAFTYWVSRQYLHISRELKRLESIKKSPVFVLFAETLEGLSVIRAFRKQQQFFSECCTRIDDMNRCHIYLWIMNRWLNFRMQLLGAFVAGFVGAAVVYSHANIGSTLAGIVLIYSMSFCDALTWLARAHADCQMDMNSVERIEEFTALDRENYLADPLVDELHAPCSNGEEIFRKENRRAASGDIEMAATIDENIAQRRSYSSSRCMKVEEEDSSKWPRGGAIRFENVSLRYASSAGPVLNDVNFSVSGTCKVGVVGRTGAGKSSLIAALFRIVEPQPGSRIFIDDVDILTLPLQQVRNAIAIVPQQPTLFRGSVRFNLDPFQQFSDAQCWTALRKAHLADYVLKMPNSSQNQTSSLNESPSLEHKMVSEGGSNFSIGQRQLLCMARAILRETDVLVLDECTASVDHETDALIQKTVREELSNCTVICIAHRLNTIAYYDRVLVMENGRVAEFGAPYELLTSNLSGSASAGIFRQMCEASGDFDQLLVAAKEAYEATVQKSNT